MRRATTRLVPMLLAPVGVLAAVTCSAPAAAAQTTTAGAVIVSGTTYTLTNVNSSMLMDIQYRSPDPGGKVIQWPANGGANQQWTITRLGSGAYTLASANSGLCLEDPGAAPTQLDQNTCTGATSQQWQLQQQSDGSYTLTNVGTGLLADVSGQSTSQGTQVIGWSANNGLNQRWNLKALTRVGTWGPGLLGGGQSFTNQTIRMVTHATVGGSLTRVRVSNLYGTSALAVGAVDLAVQSSGGNAVAGSHHAVTFGGSTSTTIAAGAEAVSDPIPMQVNADQNLLTSIYLPNQTGPSTYHQQSTETAYLSTAGNHVTDDTTGNYPSTSGSWFFVSGLDVISPTASGTVVAIGDSITDSVGTTTGANRRWPDDLARRLNAVSGGTTRGVVNAGIGSNRVLTDAWSGNYSLLKRFGHDALGQPGVTDTLVLEGINDIGLDHDHPGTVTAQGLENAYQTLIGQAHAQGVKIYGATILPYKGAGYYSTDGESVREAVNQWIRTSGAFDAVIDLDAATRSTTDPLALNPAYDTGDHLHPNDAGNQAMANAVDLTLFTP